MTTTDADHVPYLCERCRGNITPEDDGVLFITSQDRDRALAHVRTPAQASPAGEDATASRSIGELARAFLGGQPRGHWHVVHDRCLAPGENDTMGWYVECGLVRSYRALLAMAVHLGEKDWITSTDLRAVLRGYAGGF